MVPRHIKRRRRVQKTWQKGREEELDMRNVGVAMDFSANSKNALQWAMENLIRDGDSVVVVIVLPRGSEPAPHVRTLWADTGSPLIPFLEFKDQKTHKDYGISTDLTQVVALLDRLNLHRDVIIHVKIYWGDPGEKLCEAAQRIPLHTLVMGSRGQGTVKRVLLGSVSNYVVHHASCPVTVVK